MNLRALLLGALLLALPAVAAGSLDALRASARSTREQVSQLRSEQLAGRNELSRLSARIETLKTQARGQLLPGSELDGALKHSQQLSEHLTTVSQQLSGRQAELETSQLALLDGLSGELSGLRRQFDGATDRSVRRALVEKMKAVRDEREALRATLPAAKLPTLDTMRPSDDPAELLEQADLMRDREEKVLRELKALEQRLKEKKEEAELDRRLQRFVGEESLFDDQDRRLRLQKTTTEGAATTTAAGKSEASGTSGLPGTGAVADGTNGNPGVGGTSPTPGGQGGTGSLGGGAPSTPVAGGADSTGRTSFGGVDSASVRVTTGSDARVQVGGGHSIATGDEDDVYDLEIQRVKMKGLADELKKKAEQLEKKAAELK